MFYWQAIRNEFYNRYAKEYAFSYTTFRHYPNDTSDEQKLIERKHYPFSQDGTLYLTQREAECIYFLVQGLTIKSTALELLLSARTVEFYLKRIKEKFGQPNKRSLLQFIQDSPFFESFYQHLDLEFNT